MSSNHAAILSIQDAHVLYSGTVSALRGVSLEVRAGQIVALLGSNGAGKSTTLRAASGLLPAERGQLIQGRVSFRGQDQRALTAPELAQRGLVQVLEGRRCFAHLSVEENLLSGALGWRGSKRSLRPDLERIYTLFPRLRERVRSAAGYLSGGEQQMLAIGRALMLKPSLLLLDEPSIGLAPQVVQEIFETVAALQRSDGVSILIAEQNARLALRYAQHAYVLENGRVAASGSARELLARQDVQNFYLGQSSADQGQLRARKLQARELSAPPR